MINISVYIALTRSIILIVCDDKVLHKRHYSVSFTQS